MSVITPFQISVCNSICMCADTLTFSKTQQPEQIQYTKTPWNIYVKMIPTEEYITGDE